MRKVTMFGPRDLRIENVPEPQVTPDTIKLKVRWNSILAENIGLYTGSDPRLRSPNNPLYRGFPLAQAGEVIGEVVEVGANVSDVAVGDRYVTYSNYQEYHVVAPAAWARLAPNVSPETGISLAFAGTTLHCTRRANIDIGDNVLIIGQGPMGAMVTRWAAIAGAGRVIVADKYPLRLEVGRKMGATHTLEAGAGDLKAALAEATAGEGADVIIDAGNHPATLPLAMDLAKDQTRIVVLSWHTQPITIEDITRDFYHKELQIIATRAGGPAAAYRSPHLRWTGADNQRLIARFMADGRFDPAPLITHHKKIEQTADAIEQLMNKPAETMKTLIEW